MTDERAREKARKLYGTEEIQIDNDAEVSHLDEPSTDVEGWAWVQAWVLVPADDADPAVASDVTVYGAGST